MTPLKSWIARGKNQHYVVKRLKESNGILTPEGIAKMKKEASKHLGKSYDLLFEWSDDKMYCSELVWKVYKEALDVEIGELQRIGEFDLSDKAVQSKVKERYGEDIPLDELVISPDRKFNAGNLMTVLKR